MTARRQFSMRQTHEEYRASMALLKERFICLMQTNEQLGSSLAAARENNSQLVLKQQAEVDPLIQKRDELQKRLAEKRQARAEAAVKATAAFNAAVAGKEAAKLAATQKIQQARASIMAIIQNYNAQQPTLRASHNAKKAFLVTHWQNFISSVDGDVAWYAARGEGHSYGNGYHEAYLVKASLEAGLASIKNL